MKMVHYAASFGTILLMLALAGSVTGCGTYNAGSLMHPQIDTVFIPPINNESDVPQLGPQLRTAISSLLMRDGSVKLTSREKADTVLSVSIKGYNTSQAGSAKIREDELSDDDGDEYQTTVYQTDVNVKMRLTIPNRTEPVLDWQDVNGKALVTRLPDMAKTQRAGLRQAAENAARKIVNNFTEAW